MPRTELTLNDGTEYTFIILPGEDGKSFELSTKQWQPGDPVNPWRVPLHNWIEGLGQSRLKGTKTYAKSHADVSYSDLLVPPPLLSSIVAQSSTWGYATGYYGGATYGGVPYAGTNPVASFIDSAVLNNKVYFIGGRYCYSIDSAYTLTLEKDFGEGAGALGIATFRTNLVVAMGETEKIWEYDSSADTWTQATDSTYAIALGIVGDQLWRAESTNKISNCLTTPLTLTNWAPSSPNQYSVGDSTYKILRIIEYAGAPWIEKADGIYAPDEKSEYKNQAPQLRIWPNEDTSKGSMFTARSYLWAQSPAGLLRISNGESFTVGPEKTGRPDYRFHTHGGVQFGDDIYLVTHDHAHSEETAVLKIPAGDARVEPGTGYTYPYHELVRLGSTDDASFITASAIPELPTIFIGQGGVLKYFKLGRGGGRHIDDAKYAFGTSFELETGAINPVGDLSVECHLQGIEALLDVDSSETVTLQYALEEGAYNNLLDTQEGGGTAAITNTSGYARARRYAPTTAKAQYFRFKLSGTLDSGLGSDRPEIRELWAWGWAHPSTLDIISTILVLDKNSRSRGIRLGRGTGEQLRQLRNWQNSGTILTATIVDYEESRTTRFQIVGIKAVEGDRINTNRTEKADLVEVQLLRLDYAGAYASA